MKHDLRPVPACTHHWGPLYTTMIRCPYEYKEYLTWMCQCVNCPQTREVEVVTW